MNKAVVLMLEKSHESDYGEYTNIPVYNYDGDVIGYTGGEVPESGHPCEFNTLGDEGFTSCASSTAVNKLRDENKKLRELAESMYDDLSHQTFLPDWLPDYKRQMQELGIEVD